MPLYEYECRKCGKRTQRIQRVSAVPLAECPLCGGELHRLLGVPALQFKGSGWYVTDYGKGNGRAGGHDGDSGAPESGKETTATAATSEKASAPAKGESQD